jgi:hypothetical protein
MQRELGDDIGIRLDCVDDIADQEQVEHMLAQIDAIARIYGFKLRQSGTWPAIRKYCIDEQAFIDHQLSAHPD